MKRISYYSLVGFFVFAGLYHFINPDFYYPLIPDYLPNPKALNAISGAIEIGLGLLLLVNPYRKLSAYLLMALMIVFIPAHVHFIRLGSCIENGLCVPEWIGWIRLIMIHPLLIYWIFSNRK